MNPPHREKSRSKPRPAVAGQALPSPERAELQRQGAKAAARGDDAASNPMHDLRNKPAATGESTGVWRERQEAWQQGHEAQSGAADVPASPAGAAGPGDGRDGLSAPNEP